MTALHVVRDTDTFADVRAQRDALLGVLAELMAQTQAAPYGPGATDRGRVQRENDAAAYWHGRTAVESDEVQRWRDIAARAER